MWVPRPGSWGTGRALGWGGAPTSGQKGFDPQSGAVLDGALASARAETAARLRAGGRRGTQQPPARAPGSAGGFFSQGTGAGPPGGFSPSWLGGRGFEPRRGRATGGWVSGAARCALGAPAGGAGVGGWRTGVEGGRRRLEESGGARKLVAGGWVPQAGGWGSEVGGWRLGDGCWRLGTGGRRPEARGRGSPGRGSEAVSRRLEARDWASGAGGWTLQVGGWGLASASRGPGAWCRRLEARGWGREAGRSQRWGLGGRRQEVGRSRWQPR